MLNPVSYFFYWSAGQLADRGLIDEHRGQRIADLSWPRFLTMFARNSQRVADVSMVGLTIGPVGVAGLAFANIFRGLGIGLGVGVAGGTISQVSQRFGADEHHRIDLAVKQSVWVGTGLMLPLMVAFFFIPETLIGVLTDNVESIRHGSEYLKIISLSLVFSALNLISSRTLAGADDTWLAMTIRATGAFANIIFNAIFIFGLGMGAAGAALGTVLADAMVTSFFAWGFIFGSVPIIGDFPVGISVGPPYFDLPLTKQLLTISPPLMVMSLARTVANFPLFALLAGFGPVIVAAFEIALRVRGLLGAFGTGFSMSATSLVGQELGRGDEDAADDYRKDVIRLSTVIYIGAAILVLIFAPQISLIFADDPTVLSQTVPFIRVGALSFVGFGLSFTFQGVLKAAGDNRWSMYARLVGKYLVLLPLVYLGTVTALGVIALYLALVSETWSSALITRYRVNSGRWKKVSRSFRPDASTD